MHACMMALAGLTLSALALATAADEQPLDRLPERPRLENYDNQTAFIRDVLAWKKLRQQLSTQPRPTPAAEPDKTKGKDEHDWHHVTGPEKLDQALRNAYGYEQPNYREKYRFNRTTHLSFPLERLAPGQLSRSAITGGLQDLPGEGRSLQPLPELRTIIEETNEMLELGELSPHPRQSPETGFNETPRVTQRVDVVPR